MKSIIILCSFFVFTSTIAMAGESPLPSFDDFEIGTSRNPFISNSDEDYIHVTKVSENEVTIEFCEGNGL